jgi:tetratricopeptide (TPR) repeat protein
MRISQATIVSLLFILIVGSSGCSVINKVYARNDITEGAKAYKDRKFDEAEVRFRRAISLDPSQDVALMFLARTLHSEYLAKRDDKTKAEQAIEAYKQILAKTPSDDSAFKAVSSLLDNLGKKDEQLKWLIDRSVDTAVLPEQRAEAYTSLASKEYTCANEITEPLKDTVEKGGKANYVFKKPATTEEFDKLRGCVQRGTDSIDKAIALNNTNDSIWSYKASLLYQSARIAEMDGKIPEKDAFMKQGDEAKAEFTKLSKARKEKEEAEAKKKAEEEEKK